MHAVRLYTSKYIKLNTGKKAETVQFFVVFALRILAETVKYSKPGVLRLLGRNETR